MALNIYPMPLFVKLLVNNVKSACLWYETVLGFQRIFTLKNLDGELALAHVRLSKNQVSQYIGEADGYCFAIVEYMSGITLRDFLLGAAAHNNIRAIMYDVGIILSKLASFKFSEAGFLDDDLQVIPDNAMNP